MCDLKRLSGRCFPKKEGTQAVVEMTEHMTALPKEHIIQTSRELKKEGKSLPEPSQEEVVELAMANQFQAKYDPRIPESKRQKLAQKWEKAEKEKPNGGEFHSWKNTMIESVKRYRKAAAATLLGVSILATAGCGMGPKSETPAPSPEVSVTAPATNPSTQAPTASPTQKPADDTPLSLKRQGVEKTGQTLSNSKGSYPEVTLNSDSVLMKWDESKNDASTGITKGWTKKDVNEAQQFASKFLVNKVIDSPVNGDSSRTDQWVKENKESFHPDYRDEIIESAKQKDANSFLFKETWQDSDNAKSQGYGYVYDGNTPRIKSLNLGVVHSENLDDQGMYFNYAGSYTMNAKSKSGSADQLTEVEDIGIAVVKDNGKFYIGGVYSTVRTAKSF